MRIPKVEQLPSGHYFCRLRLGGVSVPITGDSQTEVERLAYLKKSEFLAGKTHVQKLPKDITLQEAMNAFLKKREKTLSPSTYRSYKSYSENRFQGYRKMKLSQIKWQEMIDNELIIASEKTTKNAWSFVSTSLKAVGYPVPHVNLVKPIVTDLNFLQPEEIPKFCQTLKGRSYEIPALLALHGLRMSEIRGLNWSNVDLDNSIIFVQGARVRGVNGDVDRKQNKNQDSSRYVPIMIPRLSEALTAIPNKAGKVCSIGSNTLLDDVKRCCKMAGVTICTVHDLRRSFASLCFYLQIPSRQIQEWGGWHNDVVLNKIYIKLSNTMKTESKDKFTKFFANGK